MWTRHALIPPYLSHGFYQCLLCQAKRCQLLGNRLGAMRQREQHMFDRYVLILHSFRFVFRPLKQPRQGRRNVHLSLSRSVHFRLLANPVLQPADRLSAVGAAKGKQPRRQAIFLLEERQQKMFNIKLLMMPLFGERLRRHERLLQFFCQTAYVHAVPSI